MNINQTFALAYKNAQKADELKKRQQQAVGAFTHPASSAKASATVKISTPMLDASRAKTPEPTALMEALTTNPRRQNATGTELWKNLTIAPLKTAPAPISGLGRVTNTIAGGMRTGAGNTLNALAVSSQTVRSDPAIMPAAGLLADALTKSGSNPLKEEATHEIQRGQQHIDRAKQGAGFWGGLAVDAGVAGTQFLGDAAFAALTGGASMIPMAARAFGGAAYQAEREGASLAEQTLYGGLTGATAALVGKLSNVGGVLSKTYGKGVLDKQLSKLTESAIGQAIKSGVISNNVATAIGAGFGEGLEEVIESTLSPLTAE